MIEKNVQEAKIRKGSPARNPVCYQTTRDIVIPAGTILREAEEARGGSGFVECVVGLGKQHRAFFVVKFYPAGEVAETFKKVIA